MDVDVHIANAQELEYVAALYVATGYAGGIARPDRVVVAIVDESVVGALRLTRERGLLLLRGMQVAPHLRRQGIGTRLLDALGNLTEPCYCVPYVYLGDFYAQAGFEPLQDAEAPAFLSARAADYRQRGLDVLVMKRRPRHHIEQMPLAQGN